VEAVLRTAWTGQSPVPTLRPVSPHLIQKRPLARPFSGLLNFSAQLGSVQMEIDFDVDLHSHRLAIFISRLENPGFYGFDGLFIQTQS
jgi:hypothetical protein